MSLPAAFLAIVEDWGGVFPRQRTFQREVRQSLGSLVCLGQRCLHPRKQRPLLGDPRSSTPVLSRIIWTGGGQQRSWSAEYFLHSRSQGQLLQIYFDRGQIEVNHRELNCLNGAEAHAGLPAWT